MAPRGRLLAEELAHRTANETGGNERLAWLRRVSLTAETVAGAPFVLPEGCSWANAHYSPHNSMASWVTGSKPVASQPDTVLGTPLSDWRRLAGKVRPANTRKRVVAYCVRLLVKEPAQPEAVGTLAATSNTIVVAGAIVAATTGKKKGRPSPKQLVRAEAKRQIREELDSIDDLLKNWAIELANWLTKQPGKLTVRARTVGTYVRYLHRIAKRLKHLKSGK
jgi:hypothetical protein